MTLPAQSSLHSEIARLRDREGLLCEQVRQLNELLAPSIVFPRVWKLTAQESRLVGSLYVSSNGFRTKAALHVAVSGDLEVETNEKLVDVVICKIRPKLPKAVQIETVWGEGYQIDVSGRRYLAAALGHPTDPQSLIQFIGEAMAMSFDIVRAPAKVAGGGDASVVLSLARASSRPRLIVSLRAHFAVRCGFTAADTYSLHIGRGEKKGLLRLVRDPEGGFKPKPLKHGALTVNCGHIERFGTEAEPKESVRADIIDADTVEIVLPKWADECED
ncbi:helix-turn-helix domain-containing protein [Nitrobacteraceae bacterium UC4446_H13]